MDVLDKYKETWKNQPEESNKLSKVDIYKMAHKKSSSIVKWIFIIGVLEFVFITVFNFAFRLKPEIQKDIPNLNSLLTIIEVISYLIITYFLFQFYKNYKSISTSDDTKTLMNKILRTRKTVKNYVIINLSMVFILSLTVLMYIIYTKDFGHSEISFYLIMVIGTVIFLLIIIMLYWLFYQLLYGILLRKLNRNYKELAKLDELN